MMEGCWLSLDVINKLCCYNLHFNNNEKSHT
jgi:hypothetical protein